MNVILLYTEYSTSYKQNKAFCGSVLLHLMHLKEMLTLLIEIFTTEEKNKIIITEARSFVTKQLNWCLDGLLQDIKDPSALKEKGESFVYFIDLALEKLLEFDFNGDRESAASVLNTFRSIVEELLSYAMSVAQIATEYYGVIKGSCQSVNNCYFCMRLQLIINKLGFRSVRFTRKRNREGHLESSNGESFYRRLQ